MNRNTITRSVPTLAAQFEAEGFRRGIPPHVRLDTLFADDAACREALCPGCGREGLTYTAYHKGGRYRVVGTCLGCQTQMEF